MSRRRDRAERMGKLLEQWRESGLSLRAFADRKGVPYSTLVYWRHQKHARPQGRKGSESRAGNAGFVEVVPEPISVVAGVSAYVIRLPGGLEVQVPSGFDAADLALVVRALRSC